MAVTIAKLRETFQSPNTLTDSELRAKAESIGVEVERPNTLAEEWAEKMWGTNYSTNPATARFVMTVGAVTCESREAILTTGEGVNPLQSR